MKPLALFLVALVLVFGALAAVITLSRDSARVFVVVDSSFPMRQVWTQLPGALADIEEQGYSGFALATEKDLIHTWGDQLRFRETRVYAPCEFSEITDYPQADQADERVLITTPASCPTDTLGDWQVILLQP